MLIITKYQTIRNDTWLTYDNKIKTVSNIIGTDYKNESKKPILWNEDRKGEPEEHMENEIRLIRTNVRHDRN